MYPSRITRFIKQWLDENSLDYDKELHEFGIKPVMIQFTSKYDSLATSNGQTATKFTTLNNEIKVREHLRKLIVKRLTDSNLEQARHKAIANAIANNVYAIKQPNKATYVVEREIDNWLDEIFINYHQLCQFKDNQNVEDNPCIYELDTNYDEGYCNEQTDRVICLVDQLPGTKVPSL